MNETLKDLVEKLSGLENVKTSTVKMLFVEYHIARMIELSEPMTEEITNILEMTKDEDIKNLPRMRETVRARIKQIIQHYAYEV